jgi:uncharacterized protein YkwD
MSIKYFAVFLLIYLLIPAFVFAYFWNRPQKQELPPAEKVEPVKRITKSEYLEKAINEKRLEKGLNALEHDEALCKIAYDRAQDLYEDYSHNKFMQQSYDSKDWSYIGENLYRNMFVFADWNEPLNLWTESPSHNQNMFDPIWTKTCLICDSIHCVQIFADAPPAKPE